MEGQDLGLRNGALYQIMINTINDMILFEFESTFKYTFKAASVRVDTALAVAILLFPIGPFYKHNKVPRIYPIIVKPWNK